MEPEQHRDDERSPAGSPLDPPPGTTVDLLRRARGGDRNALERLCARYLPRLTGWAKNRLPAWARERLDTKDLVQETLFRTIQGIDGIQGDGIAFNAYLRKALENRIRDEVRRARRRPEEAELDPSAQDGDPSPLETLLSREKLQLYESALARLREQDREACILRIEMGLGYGEIAEELGKPSANAARMAVNRAVLQLVQEMADGR